MTTEGRPIGIEALLGERDWLRRLARHLVGGDAAAADDLAQEVWLAAHQRGPDPDRPPRPWLRAVLANLGRARRRNDGRRLRREQQWQTTAAAPPEVPAIDEVYQRLELQRLVAEQVMALEEPLRAVIVLRYFEDLDSVQIARLTGAPEGTVRWRLKVALDRLRAALDARHGGRRKGWVAVLAPAAAASTAPPPTTGVMTMASATATTTTKIVAAAAALLILLLLSLGPLRRWLGDSDPAISHAGRANSHGARPGGSGRGRAGVPAVGLGDDSRAALAGCRTALRLVQREAEARERAARAWVPSAAFHAGEPNPRLEAEVEPHIARFWPAGQPGAPVSRELTCRGWACRLAVTIAADDSGDVGPWLRSVGPVTEVRKVRQLPLGGASSPGVTLEVEGSTPAPDDRSGRPLERFVFHFGAPPAEHASAGDPAAAGGRAVPAAPDSPPPEPTGLADCQERLAATRERARARLAETRAFLPPAERFRREPPDPPLAATMKTVADQVLAGQRPTSVECHAAVCRLQFAGDVPPAATIDRLNEAASVDGRVVSTVHQTGRGEVFVAVARDGWKVMSRLLAPSRSPGFFAGCPEPPHAGKVLLRLHLPSTGRRNDQGALDRISVRVVSGNLANTPAGVCLAEKIAGLVGAEELPRPIQDLLRFESWSWAPGTAPQMRDR
jgi:RNA polymerase sigma factor (sigma-70 family)